MQEVRRIEFREVFQGAFSLLRKHAAFFLAVFLAFAASLTALDHLVTRSVGLDDTGSLFTAGDRTTMIVGAIASIFVHYLFIEHVMVREGMIPSGLPKRFLSFFGASLLVGLGTGLAYLFLIFPGLIVSGRWVAFAPYLIAGQRNADEAMGKSWEVTKTSQGPLATAMLVMLVVSFGLAMVVGAAIGMVEEAPSLWIHTVEIGAEQVINNVTGGFGALVAIAVYGLIEGSTRDLDEVFA